MNKLRLYSPWCIWEHKIERGKGEMLILISNAGPLELFARQTDRGVATIYFMNDSRRNSNTGWWHDMRDTQ